MKLTLSIPASSLLMMFTSRGVFAVGSTTYLCDNSSRNSICIKTPEGTQTWPPAGDGLTFRCPPANTYGICCSGPWGVTVPMNKLAGCVAAGSDD
ncbi:hypothetical protein Pst134EA_013315 [Puccinia striiformis f. sp. tritici]|uniref:Secreted protein n=1 Tax=Puccinia striiformis f. sp. tritici PST-78 TaxID=1165861 RepID=A0A0L0VBW3_9BASI|nr:hypothetical protein Pst134EA_013315 [Puccinia striiformis f. sp. tritici]KAH9454219.1 hypothetical protein Pst134EB_014313 [Puccinia striiformis f. sp. tritici]KAH9465431.1 hypothetical protein Pst134EA_013315 [Puccinia striiformis f. sp. tritici]KAI9603719.1 hypothetical protein H4Q26_003318 [Puccinia striiformis f. sp. tritici PST-130]KNE96696.1 hypothetical protein PSTG_09967 [Puccinia striiformis f. sp. tritici PST-78]